VSVPHDYTEKLKGTEMMKAALIRSYSLTGAVILALGLLNMALAQMDSAHSTLPDRNQIKPIRLPDIYSADKEGLLDKNFYDLGDSLMTCLFHGSYWFNFKRAAREWDEDRAVELFAYSDSAKRIWQVTHHDLSWSNAYGGTTEHINFFKGRMLIHASSEIDDPIGHSQVLLVEPLTKTVAKEISFGKGMWIEEMRSIEDTLYLDVQPMGRKLNIDYYLLFWLPRGRSPKWTYIKEGTPRRVFLDKDFNVIKDEEIRSGPAVD
jgi:hypothetical protein